MKKSILLIGCMLFWSILMQAQSIQEKDVPADVKHSCMKNFPEATDVKWAKKDRNYECKFMKKGKSMHCEMDMKGKILQSGEEIKQVELPTTISNYLKLNYKNEAAKSIYKVKDNMGKMMYELEVGGKKLTFDEKGNLMKK